MDKNKGVKIPVQLRVNMWLGLSANEKKFNTFAEGNFSVYAEMVESTRWGFFVFSCVHLQCENYGPLIHSTSFCSMRTRHMCLASGERPAWLAAISSPT